MNTVVRCVACGSLGIGREWRPGAKLKKLGFPLAILGKSNGIGFSEDLRATVAELEFERKVSFCGVY